MTRPTLPLRPGRRQRGAATLAFALLLMFLIFGVVFFGQQNTLMEVKLSNSHYRSAQVREAAEAGLERGIAWLGQRVTPLASSSCAASGTTPVQWEQAAITACPAGLPATPHCNGTIACACLDVASTCNLGIAALQGATVAAGSTVQDPYTVSTHFRVRATATQFNEVEVIAIATTAGAAANDPYLSRAVVTERVRLTPPTAVPGPGNPMAPILIHGSLTDSGNPDVCPSNVTPGNEAIQGAGSSPPCAVGTGMPGPTIVTYQPNITVLDVTDFDLHGGATGTLNAPGATVHSTLFPNLTEAQIRTLSNYQSTLPLAQRTVFYYGTGSAYTLSSNVGPADFASSATKPVLVYISSSAYATPNACPGVNPGTYYGVFYYGSGCNANGFGATDVYGVLAFEGNVQNFNANAIIRYFDTSSLTGGGGDPVLVPGTFARQPGSWQDLSR